MTDLDVDKLAATARTLLDGVHERFVAGVGAPSAVAKGPDDFATAVDLEIERRLTGELAEQTGIAVHGEEFGGPDVHTGPVWVLDPIDGTFNYSYGLPSAGTLLALLDDGVPVAGFTWLPMTRERYWAAGDGPLVRNDEPLPQLSRTALSDSIVAFGAFNVASRGRIPGAYRVQLLAEISRVSSRIRMHGSTGLDLAYTSAGVLGASVVFGHKVWDNAAGAFLTRAAGGVVTDLAGEPWTVDSTSVLAASPGVHEELRQIVDRVNELDTGEPS